MFFTWARTSRIHLLVLYLGIAAFMLVTGSGFRYVLDLEGWTAAFTGLTALILGTTAFFALLGIHDAKQTRHGQLVTDLTERWDSERTHESMIQYSLNGPTKVMEVINAVYEGELNEETLRLYMCLLRWPDLIETIGVLHDENVLNTEIVYKLWGPQINAAWEVWEDAVARLREVANSPASYFYFEKLSSAMREAALTAVEDAGS